MIFRNHVFHFLVFFLSLQLRLLSKKHPMPKNSTFDKGFDWMCVCVRLTCDLTTDGQTLRRSGVGAYGYNIIHVGAQVRDGGFGGGRRQSEFFHRLFCRNAESEPLVRAIRELVQLSRSPRRRSR